MKSVMIIAPLLLLGLGLRSSYALRMAKPENAAAAPPSRRTLTEIMNEWGKDGTDKVWRHAYHRYYEREFAPYRDQEGLRLLEIGADGGQSLKVWKDYFSRPAAIHGVAYLVDPEVARWVGCGSPKIAETPEQKAACPVKVFYLDQSNTTALEDMSRQVPEGWDLIIDDGSHVPVHQLITFKHLFPKLRPGGLYVIEDVESSYLDAGAEKEHRTYGNYGNDVVAGIGKSPPANAVEKFKELVDVISRRHFGQPELSAFDGADAEAVGVKFGDGIIFVEKRPATTFWQQDPKDITMIRADSQQSVDEWKKKVASENAQIP